MVNRRRSLRRLLLMPQVLVSLERARDYVLFDLSEGGLSVYDQMLPQGGRDFQIAFRLPGDPVPIKTRGEIAWVSKSKNRTGVRFTGLPTASRLHLKDWMATRLSPVPPRPATYEIERPSRMSQFAYALQERPWLVKYLRRGALVIAILVAAFLFARELSNYHSNPSQSGVSDEFPAVLAQTQADSGTPAAAAPKTAPAPHPGIAKPTTSNPSNVAASQTGELVLQVGAMKEESNAVALAASLEQRGFPVISFQQGDGLYRIAVGPYPDTWAAKGVKKDLQAQGFESFIRRLAPQ